MPMACSTTRWPPWAATSPTWTATALRRRDPPPEEAETADGLSLVPPRSALWLNARGERIGPQPLVGYTDTRFLVEQIVRQPGKYSWQLLNWKIAARELAVSGSDYMTAFREKNKRLLVKHLLFGNDELVERLARECPEDFLVADELLELVDKMNQQSLFGLKVDGAAVEAAARQYDDQIDRGPASSTTISCAGS